MIVNTLILQNFGVLSTFDVRRADYALNIIAVFRFNSNKLLQKSIRSKLIVERMKAVYLQANQQDLNSLLTTNNSNNQQSGYRFKKYHGSSLASLASSIRDCKRPCASTNRYRIHNNHKSIQQRHVDSEEKENRVKSSIKLHMQLRNSTADRFYKNVGSQAQGVKSKEIGRNRLVLQSQSNIRKIRALKLQQTHFGRAAWNANKYMRRARTEQNDSGTGNIINEYKDNIIQTQQQQKQESECRTHCQSSTSLFERTVRIIEQFNRGSTSTVYRAVILNRSPTCTYEQIIVKKVEVNEKHMNREAEFVKNLRSPYLVQFKGIYSTSDEQKTKKYLNIMMQKYDFNLREVLATQKVDNLTIKLYLYQMLRSLVFLHAKSVCHRDIKPQNFLVKGWKIVLSDFGMSKYLRNNCNHKKLVLLQQHHESEEEQSMTYVFAREYRAPELLFDYKYYDINVDIWALGCIAVEMMTHKQLFAGSDNLDQLTKIFRVLGTPKWPKVSFMNKRIPKLPKMEGMGLSAVIGQKKMKEQKHFLSLASKMLEFDPQNRISAIDALTLPFFDEIRQQNTYRSISKLLKHCSLFSFPKEQIFGKEELLAKLVPHWIRQHCKKL